MRDRTIRTIGATLVLAFVAIAAVAQMAPEPATELGAEPDTGRITPTVAPVDATAPTLPEPFVYRIGVLSGVTTDNYWAFYGESPSVWDAYILGPTKPALYTLDHSRGGVVPELAIGEPSAGEGDGPWQVRVDMRSDSTWSDGRPVTAEDVAFTFDTVRRLELGGAWAESFPAEVADVRALSPTEALIEFTVRPTLRLWPHSVGMAPIMPAHVWAGVVDGLDAGDLYRLAGAGDVGGGPLALDLVTPDLVVSVRNPGYAPTGATPDIVEYHVLEAEDEAVRALSEGSIDVFLSPTGLTGDHVDDLVGDEHIEVISSPANGVRYLGFNLDRAPMSEHSFRAALALLLDRDGLPSSGAVADSYIGPANESWFDAERAAGNAVRYQGELANRLERALIGLRQAGYVWEIEPTVSDGALIAGTGLRIDGQEPGILTILTPGDAYDPARPVHAAGIAEVLGWLGFDARPVETDFDTVVDLAFTPDQDGVRHYDMYLLGWTLGSPALPDFHGTFFSTGGIRNNTGYASERFMGELTRYRAAHTLDEARDALWAMEEILSEDLPYLLLHTALISEAYRSDRVAMSLNGSLGGLQARLGGIGDIIQVPAPTGVTLGG